MLPHVAALSDSTYRPVWLDSEGRPETLAPLEGDARCQLLIVGGGFTGLWAALQVKEQQPDLDVVLVEQTFIGDGASGRNGGFLNTSLTHGETNGDYHFPGEAEHLEELGLQNMKAFIETLERYNIDAEYEHVGHTAVATNEAMALKLRSQFEAGKAAGRDVVWFDGDDMRRQVNSPTYKAGLWHRDGQDGVVNPGKLCWGLKKTILSLGVRIFENTPVLDVAPDGDGMLTTCASANIRSDKILMATNAFRGLLPQIRRQVIPVWDYQIATEPLTPEQLDSINWGKNRHALSNEAYMFHYYRMTKDNRITWGGGGAVCYYYGSRTDQGVADDRGRFERLSKEFFETFPQLQGVRFSHRWSGIIASSTRFCMVPGVAFDGRVSWAVGYTGLGVGATRFGARIGLELLGYQPSDILDMLFVKRRAMNWAPEPLRWIGVTLTRHALAKADANGGKRGLWLKLLDYFHLTGFAC
ncbi:MAG: FAD-dependent oxidoreductase [Rhodospirillaceae bacterium]|jgi:glycine/D-amino acid oxidase-like deaminating enzyme|nr:FAD-dependent oxidoreductase [Rhodospirillaceae bacterium]MBT5244083.1 FAD-dependent oxidoreductase [Rhodospirillaceae bacterium]MBT5560903.1 FAD-dependent oxidoreductase [Rhodospirillaceae bacterium]MBT7136295.1 FAD-dependent oxidoreductase [Rhodospirillaceae bacterium]